MLPVFVGGPLPVQMSGVGRCRASWAAWVMASGVGSGRLLSGCCGAVVGRGAVLLHGVGSVPGVVSSVLLSIVAGYGGAWVQVVRVRWLWAVQPGRVRLLGVLPGPWPVLCSACQGCWRCVWRRRWLGSWRRAVLMLSGSCLRSGFFPNCIAGFRVYPDRFLRR